MRFAICNETFQDWPFDRAFAAAREYGYTGIEFAPFTIDKDVRKITAARRAEVRKQVEAADLQTVGLHWRRFSQPPLSNPLAPPFAGRLEIGVESKKQPAR